MDRPTPLDRRHPLREYIVIVGRLWGREISGPILAGVSIVLAIAYACYADNANATVALVKYAAWLTGAISILLVFIAQYKAWFSEREKFEAEVAKNQRWGQVCRLHAQVRHESLQSSTGADEPSGRHRDRNNIRTRIAF
jgi:hypothetical protein